MISLFASKKLFRERKLKTPDSAIQFQIQPLLKNSPRAVRINGQLPRILKEVPKEWELFLSTLYQRGIIHDVTRRVLSFGDVKITVYEVSFQINREETDGHHIRDLISTHGVSLNAGEALSKAFGEFFERYPLLLYHKDDLLIASVSHLGQKGSRCLDPATLAGPNDQQKAWFPVKKVERENLFGWVQGKSLMTKRTVWLQAQTVFWNYCGDYDGFHEPTIREINTSGAGGFFSLEGALLSAIYELVQRDGFLIYWLNNQPPPRIDISTISDESVKKLIDLVQKQGLEVTFLDTTTDIAIPSCVCVIMDKSGGYPRVALGGGSGLNPEVMIKCALLEALMIRSWMEKSNLKFTLPQDYHPFQTEGIGLEERAGLWANIPGNESLSFFSSGPSVSLSDLSRHGKSSSSKSEELKHVIKKFKLLGAGHEIFYYRSDQEILRKVGYESVRAVIPALLPLYMVETNAPLGAKRLHKVPQKLGFSSLRSPNPLPHPFL